MVLLHVAAEWGSQPDDIDGWKAYLKTRFGQKHSGANGGAKRSGDVEDGRGAEWSCWTTRCVCRTQDQAGEGRGMQSGSM